MEEDICKLKYNEYRNQVIEYGLLHIVLVIPINNLDEEVFAVAVEDRVHVYHSNTFTLLHTLNEHKGIVHCINFNKNGRQIATGASDKQVILWSINGELKYKYVHSSSIQSIVFNPLFPIVTISVNVDI